MTALSPKVMPSALLRTGKIEALSESVFFLLGNMEDLRGYDELSHNALCLNDFGDFPRLNELEIPNILDTMKKHKHFIKSGFVQLKSGLFKMIGMNPELGRRF